MSDMPQKRKGERVLGPYPYRGRFRVFEVSADGGRTPLYFETERQALIYKQAFEEQLVTQDHTTETALELYVDHLMTEGNKEKSVYRTTWAVRRFFPSPLPLWSLTPKVCERRYKALTKEIAVASHRGALAETKTFLNWCVKERIIPRNPAADIEGTGRRNKRKPQLRIKEARAWLQKAIELADDGDPGATAAMCAILLGLRASEITGIRVRDLDEDAATADVLWIDDAKTEGGRRTLEVPEVLREHLAALAEGKGRDALLFGNHWRDWPRKQVQRICDLAGVPKVTAHGMRGAHATLALDFGATGALVAGALGHEDERTTRGSYARPGAGDDAQRRRVQMRVLPGGKR
jgi:integrase